MTVKDQDDLNHAITKMHALYMAIMGADSIMEGGEADALEALAGSVLADLKAVQASIESAPTLLAA
jgi:hypothetical protein